MSKQDRNFSVAMRMMNSTPLASLVIAAALLVDGGSAAAQDDDRGDHERPKPSISVSGEGEVQAQPDTVAINLGVVTEAETAQQALTANNQAMQELFEVLDGQGIAEKDRQTTRFDVSPQYRREQPDPRNPRADGSREPRIIGYQVTNELRVKVREVSKLGTVLDAVVSAGSNRVHGIEFSVEDRDQLMDEARGRAIKRAREKAELLAEAAGVSLGNVITIREQDFAQPVPQQRHMMMAESRSVPIAEGEQTITAQVHVTYQLNP